MSFHQVNCVTLFLHRTYGASFDLERKGLKSRQLNRVSGIGSSSWQSGDTTAGEWCDALAACFFVVALEPPVDEPCIEFPAGNR